MSHSLRLTMIVPCGVYYNMIIMCVCVCVMQGRDGLPGREGPRGPEGRPGQPGQNIPFEPSAGVKGEKGERVSTAQAIATSYRLVLIEKNSHFFMFQGFPGIDGNPGLPGRPGAPGNAGVPVSRGTKTNRTSGHVHVLMSSLCK